MKAVIALLPVVVIVALGVAAIAYGGSHDSLVLQVVGVAVVAGMVIGAVLAFVRARRG